VEVSQWRNRPGCDPGLGTVRASGTLAPLLRVSRGHGVRREKGAPRRARERLGCGRSPALW